LEELNQGIGVRSAFLGSKSVENNILEAEIGWRLEYDRVGV